MKRNSGNERLYMWSEIKRIQVILFVLIVLIFTISLIVNADIDPYNYSMVIGRAENVQGEVILNSKNGIKININNNEPISTENIRTFTLTYNDNAITLIDGRKDIEDDLNIQTGPGGCMKIILNDLGNNESYLLLSKDTEINILARGGCIYTTEFDGEGYDQDTLQWRNIYPDLRVKVVRGTVRIYYRPNGKLRLGSPSTPNADIRINEHNINDYIDYELQVLTGEAAQQEDVSFRGIGIDLEAQLQQITQNYLTVYKVDSVDELEESIRQQLMSQLDVMKETYSETVKNMEKMFSSPMMGNIATILKVYEGEVRVGDIVVKSGELVKVKGDGGLPGKPEEF
ncbi:MAG: hypothetical protein ACOC1O_03155 [bacterium]